MVSKEILLYLLFEGVGVMCFLREIDWTGRILFLGSCTIGIAALIMLAISISFAFGWIGRCA